jgi:hypothetical protein
MIWVLSLPEVKFLTRLQKQGAQAAEVVVVEQRHLVADTAPVEIQYDIVFSFILVELKE